MCSYNHSYSPVSSYPNFLALRSNEAQCRQLPMDRRNERNSLNEDPDFSGIRNRALNDEKSQGGVKVGSVDAAGSAGDLVNH